MHTNDPGRNIPIWNSGCAGFMCTLFAGLLFEACNAQLGAAPAVQVLCTLFFAAQALAIRRTALPARARARAAARESGLPRSGRLFGRPDIVSALFLAVVGAAGASSPQTGWASFTAIFAVFLCVFPWSRIRMCRKGACAPGLMVMLGAGAALLAERPLPHPLLLAISAWILWVAAAYTWIRLVFLKQRAARAATGFSASA